ncbi:MAG: helix-turn-helix domain-containing protein, partial [Polyangiaceae bacterium]
MVASKKRATAISDPDADLSTKDRVLHMAVRMFNRQGTSAVTTNHIAAELGMSPGNLYYHYRNKED